MSTQQTKEQNTPLDASGMPKETGLFAPSAEKGAVHWVSHMSLERESFTILGPPPKGPVSQSHQVPLQQWWKAKQSHSWLKWMHNLNWNELKWMHDSIIFISGTATVWANSAPRQGRMPGFARDLTLPYKLLLSLASSRPCCQPVANPSRQRGNLMLLGGTKHKSLA